MSESVPAFQKYLEAPDLFTPSDDPRSQAIDATLELAVEEWISGNIDETIRLTDLADRYTTDPADQFTTI